VDASRLDRVTIGIGVLIAAALFPLFFKGLSGFWEDLTENAGFRQLSMGQCKIMFWVLLAAGGAFSARYNLPHWFPHFFE
jgi:hypothetical protein